MSGSRAYCTFRLSGQLYGLEVAEVQEVLRTASITRLPLAPRCVRGLVNLRGHLVTVVDLRRCLALADASPDEQPAHVVVGTDGAAVSLLVDEVGGVLDVADEAVEPVPIAPGSVQLELVRGAAMLEPDLLLLLDLGKTLQTAFDRRTKPARDLLLDRRRR